MELAPCPDCRRHVDVSRSECPFCGSTAEPLRSPAAARRIGRVTRAALFFFGAATAAACGTEHPPEETIAQPYGAPPDPQPEPEPEDPPPAETGGPIVPDDEAAPPPVDVPQPVAVPAYGAPSAPPE